MPGSSTLLSVVVFVAVAAAPVVGRAQTCLGQPSLAVSRINVGVSGQTSDGVTGFGAGVTAGNARGFVAAGATRLFIDDSEASATDIHLSAGISMSPNATSSLQLCPFFGAGFGFGPDVRPSIGSSGSDMTTSSTRLNGGIALGGVLVLSPGLSLVPHVQGGAQRVRPVSSDGSYGDSATEATGFVGGGLGLLLRDIFAFRTGVSVPLSSEPQDPTYIIGLTVWKRR
jgi:hypothetical protein